MVAWTPQSHTLRASCKDGALAQLTFHVLAHVSSDPPFIHPFIHLYNRTSVPCFTHGCLCAGSSLLGRAKQLGPHSFVHLSLFPANEQLEVALPPLQTPFQAQTFCPEFHYRRQLPLQIDARLVRELATQVEQLAAHAAGTFHCCECLHLLFPTAPDVFAEGLP